MDSYQRYEQEPQEEGGNSFIESAGRAALAFGAGAAAAYGGNRLRARMAAQGRPQKKSTRPNLLLEKYGRAEDVTRAARAERPQGVRQGKITTPTEDFPLQQTGSRDLALRGADPAADFPQQQAGVADLARRGARDAITPATTDLGSSPEAPLVSQSGAERSQEFKQRVYKSVAAKPESELPPVTKPDGYERVDLITENDGTVRRRGKSPDSYDDVADQFLRKYEGDYRREVARDEALSNANENRRQQAQLADQVIEDIRGSDESFASAYLKDNNFIDDQGSSTQRQAARKPLVVEQSAEASDTGLDQMAGRIDRNVQRDIDVNLNEFQQVDGAATERGANPVAAAKTAAVEVEGSVPITQTDLPASALSPQESAQGFLASERAKLSGLSPTRRERTLSNSPEIAEAAELYASTGDPSVLSRFSEQPSSPLTVKPRSAIPDTSEPGSVRRSQAGDFEEPLSTGKLFDRSTVGEPTGDLVERDIDLTNKISSLKEEKLNLAKTKVALDEQELMLKNAMDNTPGKAGDDYATMYGKVKYQQQNIAEPESINVDIGDAIEERGLVRRQLGAAEGLGAQPRLRDVSEGSRAFYEVDPATGAPIAETLEVRGGRRAVQLEGSKGGGRNAAEFTVPRREADVVRSVKGVKQRSADDAGNFLTNYIDESGETGSRAGTYGTELTRSRTFGDLDDTRATAGQRPTQVTQSETVNEALRQSTADPAGDVPIPPPQEQVFEQRPSPMASIEASEALRRARIEGRDPQEVLRKFRLGMRG